MGRVSNMTAFGQWAGFSQGTNVGRSSIMTLLAIAGVGIGVFIFSLVACSREEPPRRKSVWVEEEKSNPNKVIYCSGGFLGDQLNKKAIEWTIKEFEFRNPGVKVIVDYSSSDSEDVRIVKMIRSGRIDRDIVEVMPFIYRYVAAALNDPDWAKKHLVDFSEVEGFLEAHKPYIAQDESFRLGGIFSGPYIYSFYCCTWYNKRLGKQIGLSLGEGALSLSALQDCVERIAAYNQTAAVPVCAFANNGEGFALRIAFRSLLLSAVVDEQGNLPESLSPEVRKAALKRTSQAFETMGSFHPLGVPGQKPADLLLQDKAVFYLGTTDFYSEMVASPFYSGLEGFDLLELPAFGRVNYVPGQLSPSWAVMKNSPNRDLAIRFLQFLTEPFVVENWVRVTKNPTGLRETLYAPSLDDDCASRFLIREFEEYDGMIRNPTLEVNRLWSEGSTNLLFSSSDAIFDLMSGRISSDEFYIKVMREQKK